jgi:hypothetical protein
MVLCRSKQCRALLEEWPSTNPPNNQKRVSFAKYSEHKIFDNTFYRQVKAYSSDDFDMFKAEAARDARKVFDLISKFPLSTGSAIQSVLGLGLLQQEELVGLEHLITPRVVLDHMKGRNSHAALILRAQEILRERDVSDDEFHSKLAKVVISSSSRHVEKAKLKAKMSLRAENVDPGSYVRGRKSRRHIDSLSVSFTSKAISSHDKEPLQQMHAHHKNKSTEAKNSCIHGTKSSETALSWSTKAVVSKLPSVALARGLNFTTRAKTTTAHAA